MAKKLNVCLRDKYNNEKVIVQVSSRNKPYDKGRRRVSKDVREVIFGKVDGKGKEYAFLIPKRYKKC